MRTKIVSQRKVIENLDSSSLVKPVYDTWPGVERFYRDKVSL